MKRLRLKRPPIRTTPVKQKPVARIPPPELAKPKPSIEGVVQTMIQRLGRPMHMFYRFEANTFGKQVWGAELKYPPLPREQVLEAFSDLPVGWPLRRNKFKWGATHTAMWQYIGPQFRVRINLYRYRDVVQFTLTTRWASEDTKENA